MLLQSHWFVKFLIVTQKYVPKEGKMCPYSFGFGEAAF
jgi:hypothetical protein